MADKDGVVEQHQEDELLDDQNAEQEDERSDANEEDQDENEKQNDAEDDEVVITIGEEAPPHDEAENRAAPEWVKELRKRERELARENRELKQQREAERQRVEKPADVPKPTLADCDFDEEVFEQKLTAWHEGQRAVKAEQEAKQAQEREAQKAWEQSLASYNTAKATLKVPDFEDAEAVVLDMLSPTQQGIIVSGAANPANVIYALGKNPARAKELASIKDPVKYTFAVANLESQLKVTQRKAPPAPERKLNSSVAAVGVNDPKLARLEAAADKSGDRSELIRYKKELAAKNAK